MKNKDEARNEKLLCSDQKCECKEHILRRILNDPVAVLQMQRQAILLGIGGFSEEEKQRIVGSGEPP
jgi:hypothetical protein